MVFVLIGIGAAASWRAVGRGAGVAIGARDARPPPGLDWDRCHRRLGGAASTPGRRPRRWFPRRGNGGRPDRAHHRPWSTPSGSNPCRSSRRPRPTSIRWFATDVSWWPLEPTVGTPIAGSNLVILCDSLFDQAIGRPCGGPAEDAAAASQGYGAARDRFKAAPRQTISIYQASQGIVAP